MDESVGENALLCVWDVQRLLSFCARMGKPVEESVVCVCLGCAVSSFFLRKDGQARGGERHFVCWDVQSLLVSAKG